MGLFGLYLGATTALRVELRREQPLLQLIRFSSCRMSSISFPNRSSGSHEDQFYTPEFDNSSFQMNPLSSHPPRTPRTSIVPNSSSTYSNEKYQVSNEDNREKVDIEDIEIDEEEESVKSADRRIKKEEVWREMFLTSAGRDKAFVSMIMLGLSCMLIIC